jgi:uncharacterized membrane protein YfcA
MSPRNRVRFAWVLLIGSLIGWPLTALTVAQDEPQIVLALSWLAITLTALNIILTADVRNEQDDE